MTKDDALRMMLGPFKAWRDVPGNENVVEELTKIINAVEKVLAQPEQEPVAWATKEDFCRELERRLKHIREEMKIKSVTMRCKDYDIALPIIDTDFGRVLVGQVSTPPQRTWVGLTLEQYVAINSSCTTVDQAVGSTERQLKENNT